jgi:hypothetical protein
MKLLQAIVFTLSSAAMRSQQVSHVYDANGNRTSRILSTTNGSNKGLYLSSCLILVILLFCSCDTSFWLTFKDGTKQQVLQTKCGHVTVDANEFRGIFYITFNLNGEYEINPDSLKIGFDDERVSIMKVTHMKDAESEIQTKSNVSNCFVRIELMLYATGKNVDMNKMTMYVLPSKYLTCENGPVLSDTLKISMRSYRRNLFWEKVKPRPVVNPSKT